MQFPEDLTGLNNYLLTKQDNLMNELGIPVLNITLAQKFSIGQSNPTYLLISKQNIKLVLRKKPNGILLPGAHQIEREFLITQKLAQVNFPVAKPILLCDDENIIGSTFFIMKYIEGRIFTDIKLLDQDTQAKIQIYDEMARVLAQLHTLNINQIGLAKLGSSQGFYERQIKTWSRQYKLAETHLIPNMENLILWLQNNISDDKLQKNDTECLCHGDFAINNLIFHPIENKIIAVIDWELSSVGRSFADLGYATMFYEVQGMNYAHSGGIKGINPSYIGLPSQQSFVQSYLKYRKCDDIVLDVFFYNVFSMFRLASIAQGVYKRALQGNASQGNGENNIFGQVCSDLCNDAWDLVQRRTQNDPFNIRNSLKIDAGLWGNWPVSDRCKYYYYQVKKFMIENIFPIEKQIINTQEGKSKEIRWEPINEIESLKNKARNQGLWNLFCTYPIYGKGLTHLEYAFICELMGMSFYAPEIFNCNAPDTGNMEVLILYANEKQKKKYLEPLLNGSIRSAFAMTEPAVASSDATNIQCSIQKNTNGSYTINGTKWYISGAGDPRCKFCIVMGKSSPNNKIVYRQQSMVIVDLPNENVIIKRPMTVFGYDDAPHGHMEMEFKNLQVSEENLIWEEGRGFEIAQGRLGGGRLHHCMRLIGIGKRVLDFMIQRGQNRYIFKQKMIDSQIFQQELGEWVMRLEAARLMVLNAASLLDQFGNKRSQSLKALSMCKAYVPKVICDLIDSVIQIFGAEGVSQDQILSYAYAQARTLRIADGPDTVHIRQIAKFSLHQHKQSDLPNSVGYGLAKL